MTVKNDKLMPKVFYALHFCEGLAEYQDSETNNGEPYRILIKNDAINKMNPTYAGKPVYVGHVDKVDVEKMRTEADGFVVESFYNKYDGKHWVKFIIVSDKGQAAIASGQKVSNSYYIKDYSGGGEWHAINYLQEVKNAEYDHLAIVSNPRYEESVIMTPEEFSNYNKKQEELFKIANSKKEGVSMLKFFKKEKVENSADLESTVVELPTAKKSVSIAEAVALADKTLAEEGKARIVNSKDTVKVGDETLTVSQLLERLDNMKKENEDMVSKLEEYKNSDDEEKKENEDDEEKSEMKNKKKNEDKEEKKDNEDEEDEEKKNKKKNAKDNFDKLKNAGVQNANAPVVELSHTQLARGQSRYGSN